MSNITIACICLATFGVCVVLSGLILLISEYHESKKKVLYEVIRKLEELNNTASCGPRFNNSKYISVEWLLNYINQLQK